MVTTSALLYPVRSTDLARTTAATTYAIRVDRNGNTQTLTTPAFTLLRNYWFSGDAQADADGSVGGVGDLCTILQTLLNTHSGGAGFTVTLSRYNVITIANATAFRILWNNAATTLNAIAVGFAQTDPGATATSFTGAYQTRGAWCPQRAPSTDSRDIAQRKVGAAVALSGLQRAAVHSEGRKLRNLSYELLHRRYALAEYADATEPTGSLEHVWLNALAPGYGVRFYIDDSSRTSSSYSLYVQRAEEMSGSRDEVIDRDGKARFRWRADLKLRRVTA